MISIIHMWSRVVSVKLILRTMPKPYMPIKQVDLPKVSRRGSTIGSGGQWDMSGGRTGGQAALVFSLCATPDAAATAR